MTRNRLKTAANGRGNNGQFTVGNPGGPGRPPGCYVIDWQKVVAHAEAEGLDVERELFRVLKVLLRRAQKGDVAAAKLVFERLCGREPLRLEGAGLALQVVTGVPDASYVVKHARGET